MNFILYNAHKVLKVLWAGFLNKNFHYYFSCLSLHPIILLLNKRKIKFPSDQ